MKNKDRGLDQTAESTIEIRPLSVHIGAEIIGVDITVPLSSSTVATIRKALLDWKVIFFRNQRLSHEEHIQFSRNFGHPTPGHVIFGSDPLHPEIYSVAKNRTANAGKQTIRRSWSDWHSDITAAINPPSASILRGETIPPYGGDTYWTNLAVAYKSLSIPLRNFIDGLRAIHSFNEPSQGKGSEAYTQQTHEKLLITEHPIVTVHPETSERILYISPDFVKHIVGLTPRESQVLLEMLWEHAVRTEFTVRFKWEPGSVAFWDNRATAHLAPNDIFSTEFDRQLYRVTLAGDVPVGVDGLPSIAISGQPIPRI